MARVKGPLLSIEARQQFANTLCYSINNTHQYVKKFHKPTARISNSQFINRAKYYEATEAWGDLEPQEKEYWKSELSHKIPLPYNAFISRYLHNIKESLFHWKYPPPGHFTHKKMITALPSLYDYIYRSINIGNYVFFSTLFDSSRLFRLLRWGKPSYIHIHADIPSNIVGNFTGGPYVVFGVTNTTPIILYGWDPRTLELYRYLEIEGGLSGAGNVAVDDTYVYIVDLNILPKLARFNYITGAELDYYTLSDANYFITAMSSDDTYLWALTGGIPTKLCRILKSDPTQQTYWDITPYYGIPQCSVISGEYIFAGCSGNNGKIHIVKLSDPTIQYNIVGALSNKPISAIVQDGINVWAFNELTNSHYKTFSNKHPFHGSDKYLGPNTGPIYAACCDGSYVHAFSFNSPTKYIKIWT